MRELIQSVRLFCTGGGSDKEYQLRLVKVEGGFLVEYSNGKRGSALQHGLKTAAPVSEAEAIKEFEKVKKSKIKGGYTEDESGEAFVGTELAGRKTGFDPQLLTPCDEDQVRQMIWSGDYLVQIKHDGERRYVSHKDGVTVFANREGLEVPGKADFVKAIEHLAKNGVGNFEVDCEDMGDHLVIFDVLSVEGKDIRQKGFADRIKFADVFARMLWPTEFRMSVRTSEAFKGVDFYFIDEQRMNSEEGVCFKKANAPYQSGRNPTQFKFKFWESATVRVSKPHATKRSVAIEALDAQGQWVDVGNVTIPANAPRIPVQGDLIDVRYLYAYEGGSLFQPTFERFRTDLKESAASISQLKFKGQPVAA